MGPIDSKFLVIILMIPHENYLNQISTTDDRVTYKQEG